MMSESLSYFHQVFDVAVYGSGYAAYAAAMALHQAGKRVILVNRLADVLWESGRALAMETGALVTPAWTELIGNLSRRKGSADDGRLDGAIAEVIGCSLIRHWRLPVLFYVTPLAAERCDGALESLVLGTKAGLRRLSARQWIDASESGELLRLISGAAPARAPGSLTWRAVFQHHAWPDARDTDLPASAGAVGLRWQSGVWPTERLLTLTLPGDHPRPRNAILPALQRLRETLADELAGAVLSHCSVDPFPIYGPSAEQASPAVASNVACAAPALVGQPIRTLADRFALGIAAVEQLDRLAVHEADPSRLGRPIDPAGIVARETIEADVLVAGAGTGGAMAAIAAGRAGARVAVIDPLGFPGGIGTGGGIHYYWYGIPGGLQEELDRRVLAVMPLFGTKAQVMGFHPDAKKLVLEQMLDEAGARFVPHTMLCRVDERDGRRVTDALAGNESGPVSLRADQWIDATGDGDLCAMAGAAYTYGRASDGTVHAYSQSSGRLQRTGSGIRMSVVNYDAGWVDPTDSQELSRGRIVGVSQYLCDPWTPTYTVDDRPTYIAPAIGLRQARHVQTDYLLTLADLVERRTFPDAIGFTGAHYDNHAVDYEFESDEAVFWVWVCRQWKGRTACQIPYRMILPRDLDNVYLACRAIGVTADAHYSCRMQRDMQRIGEAAGIAATLAVRQRTGSRGVPIRELQECLAASGAVDLASIENDYAFGELPGADTFDTLAHEAAVQQGLADLRAGRPSIGIWYVYRAGDAAVREEVASCLQSDNPMSSWLAAGVLATRGDRRAEPRLLRAIASREDGYQDLPEHQRPGKDRYVVPHWLAAVTLLRACGTSACLPTLRSLADGPSVPLNLRTAIALTLGRLIERRGVDLDRQAVEPILDALLAEPVPAAHVHPQRPIAETVRPGFDFGIQPTAEDHRWQLDLVVARARLAMGQPLPPAINRHVDDDRLYVRRAFAAIQAQAQNGGSASASGVPAAG